MIRSKAWWETALAGAMAIPLDPVVSGGKAGSAFSLGAGSLRVECLEGLEEMPSISLPMLPSVKVSAIQGSKYRRTLRMHLGMLEQVQIESIGPRDHQFA